MRFVEKSLRRGWRRFQRENHIARAHRFARTFWVGDLGSQCSVEEREQQAHQFALRLHRNRKKCSCWMCGNLRRGFKGEARFHFQERRLRQEWHLACAHREREA